MFLKVLGIFPVLRTVSYWKEAKFWKAAFCVFAIFYVFLLMCPTETGAYEDSTSGLRKKIQIFNTQLSFCCWMYECRSWYNMNLPPKEIVWVLLTWHNFRL